MFAAIHKKYAWLSEMFAVRDALIWYLRIAVTSSETICKLYFSLNFYEARSPISASDSTDQYVN